MTSGIRDWGLIWPPTVEQSSPFYRHRGAISTVDPEIIEKNRSTHVFPVDRPTSDCRECSEESEISDASYTAMASSTFYKPSPTTLKRPHRVTHKKSRNLDSPFPRNRHHIKHQHTPSVLRSKTYCESTLPPGIRPKTCRVHSRDSEWDVR